MKYDLDLRSKEYQNRVSSRKKRPFKIALTLIIMLVPFLAFQVLAIYLTHLENQTAIIEKEVALLQSEAEFLNNKLTEIEAVRKRQILKQELISLCESWSDGLQVILKAAPAEITVSGIDISSGGLVKVTGYSDNLQAPANYRQAIATSPAAGRTELKTIAMKTDNSYTFQIETILAAKNGVEFSAEALSIE